MKRLGLIIWLLLCLFSPGRLTSWDAGIRLQIARALWTQGDVFIPRAPDDTHLVPAKNDPRRGTSFYGIGQSLLFIPFDFVSVTVARLEVDEARREPLRQLLLVLLYGPLLGWALWWGMVTLLGRLRREHPSQIATLMLFGTTLLIYSVGILQEELPIAVCLCWGTVQALKFIETRRARDLTLASLLLLIPLWFRLNVVFAYLPLFGLWLDATRKSGLRLKQVPWFAVLVGAVPVLLIYAVFAYWRFGDPFTNGYSVHTAAVAIVPVRLELAIASLFAVGKGHFTLSPILFLALGGLWRGRREFPQLLAGTIMALVVSAIFYSRLSGAAFVDGSESWGNRFQVHWIFAFAVGLALFRERFGWSLAAKSVVAISLALQVVSTFAPDSLDAFALANESDEGRKIRLLVSPTNGQLPQRLKILTQMAQSKYAGRWLSSGDNEKIARYYVPNYWGPAIRKRAGGTTGWLFWMAWLSLGGTAAVLWITRVTGKTSSSPAHSAE